MSLRYEFSELAEEDLLDLGLYVLEQFGAAIADRTITRINDACELLARHPDVGHERAEIAPPPFRLWSVGPSLIVYRPNTDPIQIARIVRGSRDIMRLLETKEPK